MTPNWKRLEKMISDWTDYKVIFLNLKILEFKRHMVWKNLI